MHKSDFRQVFEKNLKSVDAMLTVLARPNGLDRSRLGLAISKKHAPRAVDRNRIKRIVRESFMHHQPFDTAVDAVILNRSGSQMKSNQLVFESLERHWYKINQKLRQQDS